jgi:hypothetical protein
MSFKRYILINLKVNLYMYSWLVNIFSWITSFWSKVPDSIKEDIIRMIVKSFEQVFRAYFRSEKKKGGESNV